MKAQVPWSVKGVEPGAREAAKAAARRAGLTLGAWLNQVIRESGAPVASPSDMDDARQRQGFAPLGDPRTRPHGLRMESRAAPESEAGAQSLASLMRRLDHLEDKSGRVLQALEATLKEIAARLSGEGAAASPSDRGTQDSHARLAARFEAIEQSLDAIDHRCSEIEARHERHLQDIVRALERLAQRVAEGGRGESEVAPLRAALSALETRLDDVSADSRKTAEAMERALGALTSRLSAAERRQREHEATLERALNLFNERLQEALAREDNGQAEALRTLEQAVSDISQHFEAIEARREQTNRAVEESLRAIVSRIAEADRRRAEEWRAPVEAVDGALKRVIKRLDEAERRAAETAEALDKRFKELRDRTERTEIEFRASRSALMRAIDDVSEHMGTLQKGRADEPIPAFLGTREETASSAREQGGAMLAEQQAASPEQELAEREVRALVERARRRARAQEADTESPSAEPALRPTQSDGAGAVEPETDERAPSAYKPQALGSPSAGLRDAEEHVTQTRRWRVFHLSIALAIGIVVLAMAALVGWSETHLGPSSGRPSALQSLKNALGLAQARIERLFDTADGEPGAQTPFLEQEASAQEHSPKAIYARGLALARRATTPEARAEAAAMIGRAAALGDADAQFALGRLFETGRGLAEDRAAAERWYEEAAAQGHGLAMFNLGVLAAAPGTKDAYARAARWFEQAALRGITDAQFNLGVIYEQGLGVGADPLEAYAWYSVAADKGDGEAAQARDRLAQAMSPTERDEANARARTRKAGEG